MRPACPVVVDVLFYRSAILRTHHHPPDRLRRPRGWQREASRRIFDNDGETPSGKPVASLFATAGLVPAERVIDS